MPCPPVIGFFWRTADYNALDLDKDKELYTIDFFYKYLPLVFYDRLNHSLIDYNNPLLNYSRLNYIKVNYSIINHSRVDSVKFLKDLGLERYKIISAGNFNYSLTGLRHENKI